MRARGPNVVRVALTVFSFRKYRFHNFLSVSFEMQFASTLDSKICFNRTPYCNARAIGLSKVISCCFTTPWTYALDLGDRRNASLVGFDCPASGTLIFSGAKL
jgi:hypothetical protein